MTDILFDSDLILRIYLTEKFSHLPGNIVGLLTLALFATVKRLETIYMCIRKELDKVYSLQTVEYYPHVIKNEEVPYVLKSMCITCYHLSEKVGLYFHMLKIISG